jgi:integrase/recombinase XerD
MDTSLNKASLLLERYSQYLKNVKAYSPGSIRAYSICLKQFISYLKDKESLSDFRDVTKEVMRRYQSSLFERTPPFSLSTQLLKLVALRCFFSYLEKEDFLLSNPASQIELPKQPQHLPKDIFSEKEMKKLLQTVKLERKLGLRDKAILELLYSTGIRSEELASLKLVDFDEARGVVRVNQGKGDKDRVVPAGEVAMHYLKLYLKEGRKKLLLQGESPYLFIGNRGKRILTSRIPRLVQKYAKRAGIYRYTSAHMIRHTCATHMLRHRAPIRYIQELLGHASLDTTQIYTKVDISDLQKIHRRTHPREIA